MPTAAKMCKLCTFFFIFFRGFYNPHSKISKCLKLPLVRLFLPNILFIQLYLNYTAITLLLQAYDGAACRFYGSGLLFIAEKYKTGLEAERYRDLHFIFSLLLLKSAMGDGSKRPELQRPGQEQGTSLC